MARFRNRSERCWRCHLIREVVVNLDEGTVTDVHIHRGTCLHLRDCMEEMRDKAMRAPFADGSVRRS